MNTPKINCSIWTTWMIGSRG